MRFRSTVISCVVFFTIGCASTTTTNNSNSIAKSNANIQPVLSEPKWTPLTDGVALSFDERYKYHPQEMKLSNGRLLRGSDWDGYLKKYIESFPLENRGVIVEGISRHVTDFDKVENFIRFEPVRYMSGPYSKASYAALVGTLSDKNSRAFLKLHYYGSSWIFAKSFKMVSDGQVFQSPELKFNKDNYGGKVWETVFLDLNKKEYRDLVERIVSSKETIIRFQGDQYYSDLTVTDRMREDIGYMFKSFIEIEKFNK